MREHIISIIFCLIILSVTSTTLIKQVVNILNPSEEISDVNKGHEREKEVSGKSKKEAGLMGMINSFTDNLVGKSEGAKMAGKISNATSGNTYIESTQVLLGKDDWLFYKSTEDGDPVSDYIGNNLYTEDYMSTIAQKLEKEKAAIESYGCQFVLLSIPNKASIYPEYMPDTIARVSEKSKTDYLMEYLKKNSSINVVDSKPILVATKNAYQDYYKTDTHFNQIGCFMTVQALKEAIDGNYDSLDTVKFKKVSKNYAGDLANLCNMQDTFNSDIQYELDPSTINLKIKSDKRVLIIGDSFGDHMVNQMNYYFAECKSINIWSFTMDEIAAYQPDIVVWEQAERYTDRFAWVSLLGEE